MGKILTRTWRAATLNRKAFTEAFFDDDAAADAAIVVAAVGAFTYVGTLARLGALGAFAFTDLIQVLIGSVASWLIFAFATWFVATRLFGSNGRPQTMLAMQGLSALPLVLEAGGPLIGGVGLAWYLVVLVVATQEASDLDVRKSAVSVLIGFAAAILVRALISVPFAVFSGLF